MSKKREREDKYVEHIRDEEVKRDKRKIDYEGLFSERIRVLRFSRKAVGHEVSIHCTTITKSYEFLLDGTITKVLTKLKAEVMVSGVGTLSVTPSDLRPGFVDETEYPWVPRKDRLITVE